MQPSCLAFTCRDDSSQSLLNSTLRSAVSLFQSPSHTSSFVPVSSTPLPFTPFASTSTLPTYGNSLANMTFPSTFRDEVSSTQQPFDHQPQILTPQSMFRISTALKKPQDVPPKHASHTLKRVSPLRHHMVSHEIHEQIQRRQPAAPPLKKLFMLRCLIQHLPPANLQTILQNHSQLPHVGSQTIAETSCVRGSVNQFAMETDTTNPNTNLGACRDAIMLFVESITSRIELMSPSNDPPDTVLAQLIRGCVQGLPQDPLYETVYSRFDELLIENKDNATLEPNSCAKTLFQCSRSFDGSQKEGKVVQGVVVYTLVQELRFCLDTLHSQLTSTALKPESVILYRLVLSFLYSLTCQKPNLLQLVERNDFKRLRNWLMSTYFKAILQPVAHPVWRDVLVMSKIALARLDSKQRKIPRDVVEQLLRPALIQFCEVSTLNMGSIVGLHSIVEMFPTLFKEVFGQKILEVLDCFLDQDSIRRTFSHLPDPLICKMITWLLDFFRLFSSTQAFSCEQWVGILCKLVVKLEKSWIPHILTMDNTNTGNSEVQGCCYFRAPLCRFLTLNPDSAVSFMMGNSTDQCLAPLFASVLKCRQAVPLELSFRQRTATFTSSSALALSSTFSDVQLITASGDGVLSHRVVLSSRSQYFRNLFGCGMAESHQPVVVLSDIDTNTLRLLVQFLYDPCVDLSRLSSDSILDLLVAADRFVIDDLVRLCEYHISSRVCPTNCLTWIDRITSNMSVNDTNKLLDPFLCGSGVGECVLKTCQSVALSNLGMLSEDSELTQNRVVVDMLTNSYSLFMQDPF
eukprot:c5205_g1_i1.p1 GENE.c5205_g1_i1~~c5205_g1_i1.p1  ORF type:complete len:800 (-),score=102.15 c5205_g1_i1:25-2424(-)